MNKLVIAVLAIAALVVGGAVAYVVQQNMPAELENGEVPNGHLTPLAGLSATPTSIEWGNVTVGLAVTRAVNLTANGEDIGSLNMTVANYTSNLRNYTVTWDAEGYPLKSGESVMANFTLTVRDADTGNFHIEFLVGEET